MILRITVAVLGSDEIAQTITIADDLERHYTSDEVDNRIKDWRDQDREASMGLSVMNIEVVSKVKVPREQRAIKTAREVFEELGGSVGPGDPEEPVRIENEGFDESYPEGEALAGSAQAALRKETVVENRQPRDLTDAEISRMQDLIGVERLHIAAIANMEALRSVHKMQMDNAKAEVVRAQALVRSALEEIDEESEQCRFNFTPRQDEPVETAEPGDDAEIDVAIPKEAERQHSEAQPAQGAEMMECPHCEGGFVEGDICEYCKGACVIEPIYNDLKWR